MKVGICLTKTGNFGNNIINAVMHGINRLGHRPIVINRKQIYKIENCDVIVAFCYPINFGKNIVKTFRKQIHFECQRLKKRIIYIDSGCIKFKHNIEDSYYQIGFDCIKGFGKYYNDNVGTDRLDKLNIELKDWKTCGNYTLLVGQTLNGASTQRYDLLEWYKTVLSTINDKDRIAFIAHPKDNRSTIKFLYNNRERIKCKRNLLSSLQSSFSCITFSTNASITAIIEGVPTIACCPGSNAYNVCSSKLRNYRSPQVFDRVDFLSKIAYTQWNLREITRGLPFEHLFPHVFNYEDVDLTKTFFLG